MFDSFECSLRRFIMINYTSIREQPFFRALIVVILRGRFGIQTIA